MVSLKRKQTASSLYDTTLHIDPRKSYGARKTPSSFVLLRGKLLRGTTRTKIKAERENEAKDRKLITSRVHSRFDSRKTYKIILHPFTKRKALFFRRVVFEKL